MNHTGWLHWLPLEQEHTHCWSHHSKTPFQLYYLYSRHIVLQHWPWQFLLEHPNGTLWVYAPKARYPSPRKINKYNLTKLVVADLWVYVKICKGIYWLPQASILVNKLLEKYLAIRGYYQCQHMLGLWHHMWRDITFCLLVDNFGIKTTGMADMKYLVSLHQEHYSIAVNWTGSLFCRIKLMWNYVNRTIDLHMPDYISRALLKYHHQAPLKPQHAPYKATPIQFGARVQTVTIDTTVPLSKERIKFVTYFKATVATCKGVLKYPNIQPGYNIYIQAPILPITRYYKTSHNDSP